MKTRIKFHKALMYINFMITIFCGGFALVYLTHIPYGDKPFIDVILVVGANIIISIYAAIMTCRYEKSVYKLNKLISK